MNDDDFLPDDLAERLDLSFGDGPAHRPITHTLARGRRRLAGRRVTSGVAAVAVVGAVAATFAVAAGGSSPSAGIDPASSGSPSPTTVDCTPSVTYRGSYDPDPSLGPDEDASDVYDGHVGYVVDDDGQTLPALPATDGLPAECLEPSELLGSSTSTSSGDIALTDGRSGEVGADVELDSRGRLHHGSGVVIARTIDNPLGDEAPDYSAAVQYGRGGRSYFALLSFDERADGCGVWISQTSPTTEGATLEGWVDAQARGEAPYESDAGACPETGE